MRQLASTYIGHVVTRGRTELHPILGNNKPDERWALMKPNQYQITITSKTHRVMRQGAMFVFAAPRAAPREHV